MDIEKTYADIQRLPMLAGGIRRRDSEAIKFLQSLYQTVTGSTVYAGCKGCHIKAANYLISLTIQDLQTMSEQKFKLNKGVMIEWPFRSGQYLIADKLTDAKAAEYLYNNPAGIVNFSDFPEKDGELDLEAWYPEDVEYEEDLEAESKKKPGRKPKPSEEESDNEPSTDKD